MIVVRVDPAARSLTLLSLPRDLVVGPYPGGIPERLTTVLPRSDAGELVDTIEARLGIPISAFVQVGFDGLVGLVDAVGGVPMAVLATVRDRATGLWLDPADCTILDGPTTLALVRSRHLERLDASGRWVEDPTSDLGRIARQRGVLAAMVPQLPKLVDDLGGIDRALSVAADHLTIDRRLDFPTMARLARWVTTGPTPVVEEVALPVSAAVLDESAMLVLAPGADASVARMGGSLPPAATVAPTLSPSGNGGPLADTSVGDDTISSCP